MSFESPKWEAQREDNSQGHVAGDERVRLGLPSQLPAQGRFLVALRDRRPGRDFTHPGCAWLFGNPPWAEVAVSRAQHWTFTSNPRGQPREGLGYQNHGEGETEVKGHAGVHLSLQGARGCFRWQALLRRLPAALPKPAAQAPAVPGNRRKPQSLGP